MWGAPEMMDYMQGRTPAERAENEQCCLWILDGLIATLVLGLIHEMGTLVGWW